MADKIYLKDTFSDLIATENTTSKKIYNKKHRNEKKPKTQCWNEIFVPIHPKEELFVVNYRKYIECRETIIKKLNTPSIIVFTGPSGCGKNTVLNVLFHVENINIINCSSLLNTETNPYDKSNNIELSTRSVPLDNLERTITENLLLTQTLYCNEMKSTIFTFTIIPQLFLRDSFKFIQLLKKCISILNVPFVVVCGNGSQDSILIKQLASTLQDKVSIDIVNFKSITTKNLCKFSNAAMKALDIKNSHWISNYIVEELALASGGDIRNFILSIQFQYLSQQKSGNRKHSASFKDQLDHLDKIQTKDDKLSLYHCVGKVLYCKSKYI